MKKVVNGLIIIFNILLIMTLIIFFALKYNQNYNRYNSDNLLYKIVNNGNSITYQGNNNNNYVLFNNLLWNIVSINEDGIIKLILNDKINVLPYEDNITYLNDYFLSNIDKDYLVKTEYCNDIINDINDLNNCNNKISTYVNLSSISDYTNSLLNDESYIDGNIWFYETSNDNAWSLENNNLSLTSKKSFLGIKVVISLRKDITYIRGDGSKDNPYIINSDKVTIGSKIKLDNDYYIVYDTVNNYKLVLLNNLNNVYKFDDNSVYYAGGTYIYEYLNNDYYNSLSYKNYLKEDTWYIGSYDNSYNDILSKSTKSYIGMLNILDLKLVDTDNFYLDTSYDGMMFIYSDNMKLSKIKMPHSIRPCISLDKSIINKMVYRNGYYTLEGNV